VSVHVGAKRGGMERGKCVWVGKGTGVGSMCEWVGDYCEGSMCEWVGD